VRAIVMKEYGGPECLVPAERPDPVAKPGWAVVRLRTDEAAAAHAYLETGAGFGKVVLTIA
jgi:NADPH:quinone reductase-like Zn-dependent oxidoreductase